jgi:hypothetical protein
LDVLQPRSGSVAGNWPIHLLVDSTILPLDEALELIAIEPAFWIDTW